MLVSWIFAIFLIYVWNVLNVLHGVRSASWTISLMMSRRLHASFRSFIGDTKTWPRLDSWLHRYRVIHWPASTSESVESHAQVLLLNPNTTTVEEDRKLSRRKKIDLKMIVTTSVVWVVYARFLVSLAAFHYENSGPTNGDNSSKSPPW